MFQDAQQAGLLVLPVAVGAAVVSPIVGKLTERFAAKYLSTFGVFLAGVGVALVLVYVTWPVHIPLLITAQFLIGVGHGVFQVPNTTTIMLTVPTERRGIANGVRSMAQNTGKLIGNAMAMLFITVFLSTELKNSIYKGQAHSLSGSELQLLTQGFQLALAVMLVLCVAAVIASWSRGKEESK